MESIRDVGIDELAARCAGFCSLATCHAHIGEAGLELLEPMSENENDLLNSDEQRSEMSRLTCRIVFWQELEGLAVSIAQG